MPRPSLPAPVDQALDQALEAGFRKYNPRFDGENFEHNLRVADEVRQIAAEAGATPAQVSLAWLLAQGDDFAPIPGTKRVSRLEENAAADGVELTAEQLDKLTHITPPAGGHPTRRSCARSTGDRRPAGDQAVTRPGCSARCGTGSSGRPSP
jgi:hypothetical protein